MPLGLRHPNQLDPAAAGFADHRVDARAVAQGFGHEFHLDTRPCGDLVGQVVQCSFRIDADGDVMQADVGVPVKGDRLGSLRLPKRQAGVAVGNRGIRVIGIATRHGPAQRAGEKPDRLIQIAARPLNLDDAKGGPGI